MILVHYGLGYGVLAQHLQAQWEQTAKPRSAHCLQLIKSLPCGVHMLVRIYACSLCHETGHAAETSMCFLKDALLLPSPQALCLAQQLRL